MKNKHTFLGLTLLGWYIMIVIVIALIFFCSCNSFSALNNYTKDTITLPSGMKLVKVTLEKDSSMWLYMESMDSTYIPKTKLLQKTSKYGIVERKLILQEIK